MAAQDAILHVTEHCLGGVATYVAETMTRQRESGRWSKVGLVADPAFAEPRLMVAADDCLEYGSGRSPLGVLRAARRVQALVESFRPTLVHLHSSYSGVYGRLFAGGRPTDPAIVYCPHGWSFDMETKAAKQAVYRAVERRLAPKADVLISISGHDHAVAEAAGLGHGAHLNIPHGVPAATPGSPPAALDEDALHLMFVGRLGRQKGVDLLTAALAHVARQDIRLHVIGMPDSEEGAGYDLSDPRIRRHGWIDYGDIDSWYAAADALIVPSRWEGFGLVAVEAMRNGLAVLASDRGALREVLDHGAAGALFDPTDARGFANLIESLTPDMLARLGEAGRRRYQAAYTPERATASLDEAYALAQSRRKARA